MSTDLHILAAARTAIERHGWREATLERIAGEAGLSRMTLHRRGLTREGILTDLARALEAEYRGALWPALTAPGHARERLEQALGALCSVCDANLEPLSALGEGARWSIFHDPPEAGEAPAGGGRAPAGDELAAGVLTRRVFT
jgi:AcrR family transcriptional regulator